MNYKYVFYPETKQQSGQWKNVDSPRPKKASDKIFRKKYVQPGLSTNGLCSFPLHQILLTGNEEHNFVNKYELQVSIFLDLINKHTHTRSTAVKVFDVKRQTLKPTFFLQFSPTSNPSYGE
jgi:hypothetical protein